MREYPAPVVWDGDRLPCPTEIQSIFNKCSKHDVAVHSGSFETLKWLSLKFSLVFTFEPDLERFIKLAAEGKRYNVIAVNSALGDHRGPVTRFRNLRIITEPMIRVDDFNLPACDAIVVEGSGVESVVRGAEETLSKFSAKVFSNSKEMDPRLLLCSPD